MQGEKIMMAWPAPKDDVLYQELLLVYRKHIADETELYHKFAALWKEGSGMSAGEAMEEALRAFGFWSGRPLTEAGAEEYEEILKIQEMQEMGDV